MQLKRFRTEKGREQIELSYGELLAAWPVPWESRLVPTLYGSTHVVIAGPLGAPPLVLFHGVGDDAAVMWLYNIEELAARYRCYAVDTMGGPGRSVPGEGYGPGFRQAQWMEAVWRGLGIEKAGVVGVSYGGWLATEAALSLPDLVSRIVVLAGGIAGGNVMLRMLKVFLPALLVPTERSMRKALFKLGGPSAIEDERLFRHVALLFRQYNPQAMRYHRTRAFSDEELRRLADRCLWLLGANDVLADVKRSEERFRALGLHYRIIPEAWHSINHNQPQLVDRLVVEFLEAGRA
jgi:pimeloyl-ACP methyl ester carboxylesterase